MAEQPKNKQPTTADLTRIIADAVKKSIAKEIAPLKQDIDYLMQKDHDQKVIDGWLSRHPQHRKKAELNQEQWLNRELVKTIIYALAIIGALVGAKLWH